MSASAVSKLVRTSAILIWTSLAVLAFAHEWAELDPTAALADADVALTITEAFLEDPVALAVPEEPLDLTCCPPELAWWTHFTNRLDAAGADGSQRRIAILGEVARAWTEGGPPDGDVHLRWRTAMGELAAHAAARSLTDDAIQSAEGVLSDPDARAQEAILASWIVVLPRLGDDERSDLAAVFERFDVLTARGFE